MFQENEHSINYQFEFNPISNNGSRFTFKNHSKNTTSNFKLQIDDSLFCYQSQEDISSVLKDIIDFATSIHVVDRLSIQKLDQQRVNIKVLLPIRNPDLFNSQIIQDKIIYLLEWMTGSRWIFEFSKRANFGQNTDKQLFLFDNTPDFDEVALWSGGLDALAGLYNRLKENTQKKFLLLGTGSNKSTHYLQKAVFNEVQKKFPNQVHLYRVPITLSELGVQPRNKLFRARGLVFTLLGVVCARLKGRKSLNVYENGIGAINLPYRKSAVGLDHSRSMHPITLSLVGSLVSELLNEKITIQNPFLFSTKAQMCQILAQDKQHKLVSVTKSCDSPHRHKKTNQCGYCSSCILRKQSLAAAKINDETRYIVPHEYEPKENKGLAFQNMREQILKLSNILSSANTEKEQWMKLTANFLELDNIADHLHSVSDESIDLVRYDLLNMYKKYVKEWHDVEDELSQDFLVTNKLDVKMPLVSA